jgi:hypothetical protein
MDARNTIQVLSILISYVVLYLCIFFPVVIYLIAHQYVTKKMYKEKEEFIRNFDSIIGFFRSENVLQSGFFAVVAIRKFLFAFFLVFFNNYPFLDLIVFDLLSLAMILTVLKYKPYETLIYTLRDIISEVGFMVVYTVKNLKSK